MSRGDSSPLVAAALVWEEQQLSRCLFTGDVASLGRMCKKALSSHSMSTKWMESWERSLGESKDLDVDMVWLSAILLLTGTVTLQTENKHWANTLRSWQSRCLSWIQEWMEKRPGEAQVRSQIRELVQHCLQDWQFSLPAKTI